MAARRDLLLLLLIGIAAWALPGLAVRVARPALLNFGPNDADYVQGFRPEWERDGLTRFHWTTTQANVSLPLRLQGEGFLLRMRIRRHFIEPAHVKLIIEARTVFSFDIQADTKVPYQIKEIPLPRLEGQRPFVLSIQAGSDNPRPLGFAMDWMELERRDPQARVLLLDRTRWAALFTVILTFLVPRLAGLGRALAVAAASALLAAVTLGVGWDVIATERIVREGLPAYGAVAVLALAIVLWPWGRRALTIPSPACAGALVALVLVAFAVRLAVLLHPQFYYPDVKVHALFAWQLVRRGLVAFLEEFTANQYRFGLGLQFESGHWYAFPYPPGFYILSWPVVLLFRYRPEVAVSVLAAAVNSLEVLLVFGVARRLGASACVGLASSAAVPLLPLFLARLTLAYFPAVVGHAADTVLLLYLASRLDRLDRPGVVLALGGLLGLASLTYTQSILNFGLLLPVFLLLQVGFDRMPGARARQLGLVAAAALGAVLAVGLFYGRYIPIVLDMRRGVPMPEERILLEKLEHSRPMEEDVAPEEPDPYTGPNLDPVRGLRKAAWRMYVFYGVFAPLAIVGVGLVLRASEGATGRLVAAWAMTYLLLNLASGGLPGPNLVRYNKDLEIVAPLCCVGLGALGIWLWERARVLSAVYAASFVVFGASRCATYLTEKFVLER